jgi:hypothetical protein
MALRVKVSRRYASQTQTHSSHSFCMSSVKISKNISISMPACFSLEIRVFSIIYFLLWHNYIGMLYRPRITSQLLCGFIISPKGFILLVIKASLTFLISLENSGLLRSKLFNYRASVGCQSFPSFLRPSIAACQIMSLASPMLENKCFKQSIIGRYHITRAEIILFIDLFFSFDMSIFLLPPPLLPIIHGFISSIAIIRFVPIGVARWTPHLIAVFFTIQYALVQASMYFFVFPMSIVIIVSLQGRHWWANYLVLRINWLKAVTTG